MIKELKALFQEMIDRMFRRSSQRLYDQILELEQQLDEFKKEVDELRKPDIEINLIDDSEINSSPKSVRINAFVWEDWQQFCEHNNDYSKKQLISMALKEFMEKHQ